MNRPPHVLVLLENLPLDRDNRVKRECRALLEHGCSVSVICPRGTDPDPVPGVRLLTYPPPPEGGSAAAFVLEYAWSLVAAVLLTARLALRHRIDVIQACNPPDVYWLVAAPYRWSGTRFVFDHHDLSPEVYAARRGSTGGIVGRALLLMEHITLRLADHVIATNDSVRQVALERGGRDPGSVTVVRNGPELRWLEERPPVPALRRGHRHLVVWLGVVGVDDGVEDALAAVRVLVHDRGREDCLFVFLGDGERLAACRALAAELGVAEHVDFPGWTEQDQARDFLATADLALAPDPPGLRSDRSTMMKVMEYMATGLPVVAHDVHETRVSAGEAGVYADHDPGAYADAVVSLLDDPARRERMGQLGRQRVRDGLSWDHQKRSYLEVIDTMTGIRR